MFSNREAYLVDLLFCPHLTPTSLHTKFHPIPLNPNSDSHFTRHHPHGRYYLGLCYFLLCTSSFISLTFFTFFFYCSTTLSSICLALFPAFWNGRLNIARFYIIHEVIASFQQNEDHFHPTTYCFCKKNTTG